MIKILAALFFAIAGFLYTASAGAQEPEIPQNDILSYERYHALAADVDIKKHTISLNRFLDLMKKKEAIVLDLRDKDSYDREHIEGALHLGPDITAEKLASVAPSKDTTIVVYCTNSLYPTRMIALADVGLPQIIALGYKNTFRLGPIWMDNKDYEKNLRRIPMTKAAE